MAKVFSQSAFLFLVVGFLVLVKADPLHHDSEHSTKLSIKQKDHHDDDDDYRTTKLTLKQRIHVDNDDDDDDRSNKQNVRLRTHLDSETGKTVVPVRERNENCTCGDGKMKQFAQKIALVLRTYGSKELRPDLQKIVVKFVDYIVSYLAQEKPEQMGKVNNFLQNTAKLTNNAMAKGSN